ncbi:pyridoxamine 5'-phosphate oxidase [Nocardioides immobilis]|uniref:Pyridoxamine 5'-phosphate oxidase n=1 Tax=Nocardioides immobilis TaxID=2049295 RepID=A0A417Y4C6_9ACTN|nr:pyridoxamine 5'-phosphate oxidase [Nocardioides immobilis]RHW27538.1 pyridoxamine 5'-phosphate oxidase [Nocardioides immobilis]
MSIPVEIGDITAALERFGSGYLLTTTDGRVKVVTVDPDATGTGLRVSAPGRGTLGNLAANPAVTLVFPPLEQHGYSLLVDGTGVADGDDVVVTPTSAVLHRPAAHADGPLPPDGCGHDCEPVA